ncbi:hypothetical protein Lal_00003893 [Lupinus albus]|nr:hypothetical protein Lal_00003893 [Lupinus albus]
MDVNDLFSLNDSHMKLISTISHVISNKIRRSRIESDYSLDLCKICHNLQRILMPYIELTNEVIKIHNGQQSMYNGLHIGVIVEIKSYKDLKSNILSTHHNI